MFQGTYDDVTYWLKNGVVDLGFLSTSSAKDIPIEPLWRDPLLCIVPKGMKKEKDTDYMDIEEIRNHQFVTQRESTDADIQNFLKENSINIQSNYHVVDDLSTVAMVANGFGICLMPQMVMPYVERVIGLATLHPEFLAPAVRSMYNHIIENYKEDF